MSDALYSDLFSQTIRKLAEPESYSKVCHEHRQGEPMPSVSNLGRIIYLTREILFPGYFAPTSHNQDTILHYMGVYVDELQELLYNEIFSGFCFECEGSSKLRIHDFREKARKISVDFIISMPEIRRMLVNDVEALFLGDPAAGSPGEVIFCYPGIRAVSSFRIAHRLYELEVPLIPRYITEMAHGETGIDIHPAASIGEFFAIDHGTGVVIGSTCIIGNHVKLYQGVTLGARSFELDRQGNPVKGIPRHPIVEDHVVIYSGATILGRITIGKGSVIGGNVWITHSLPPGSKVVQHKLKETGFTNGAGI